MIEPLKVCTIQANLVWENIPQNLKQFEDKIEALEAQVDVIVLPEMFSTGFTMNAEEMAESMNGSAVTQMKSWAKEAQAAVCGSLIIKEDGNFFNRLIWVEPSGKLQYYDKRHLFTLAGEQHSFTAGRQKLIVEYKGWRICPLICYDLRFPVWSRNADDYDLLIFVANWPERRVYAWDQLLIARAIENQSYVIGVNRVGHDGKEVYYPGSSAVIDPMGKLLSQIPLEEESVDTHELSGKYLKEIRQKLAFLNDRDEFMII